MSSWPVVFLFAIVFGSAWILSRWLGAPVVTGRFTTIDGLRGYLAFGVFISHGAIWYRFLRSGTWDVPPSNLYVNLGQASVVLFFMITGFLFWSKLLRARSEPIDWSRLYVSRILRLLPLYAFAVALLAFTVGILTNFQLRESPYSLFKNVLDWGGFSIGGIPDINRLRPTCIIIGKVTWTLPYEWLFYCTLPITASLIGVATRRRFIVLGLGLVGWLAYEIRPELVHLGAFCGGIAAAYLIRLNWIQILSRRVSCSIVAGVSFVATINLFPSAYHFLPLILLFIAFVIIAGGNTLFGILALPASRFLGQLTYSVYLLHSIILFWMFRFVIGGKTAALYSPVWHWVVVALCIPVVLTLCCATFRWIELPAMRRVSGVNELLSHFPKIRPRPLNPVAASSVTQSPSAVAPIVALRPD